MKHQELTEAAADMAAHYQRHFARDLAACLRDVAARLARADGWLDRWTEAAADLGAGRPLDLSAAPAGIEPVARRLEQLAARLAAAERERDVAIQHWAGVLGVPAAEAARIISHRAAGLDAAPPAPAPPPARKPLYPAGEFYPSDGEWPPDPAPPPAETGPPTRVQWDWRDGQAVARIVTDWHATGPALPPAEPGSAEITVTCETPANFASNEMPECPNCGEAWGGAVTVDDPGWHAAMCLACGVRWGPVPELIPATGGA